ncbi:hypothetical protein PIROE2DRAFT_18228 [Piromyces sp. E2]|nr:hypothetical protein PIROE2DRAFT_18228 [Piromyces sp. E2]|eukprot:OUM56948.1 hypothetical protein PIROE2DRAFT_18228 [Piromyces sp. E2]
MGKLIGNNNKFYSISPLQEKIFNCYVETKSKNGFNIYRKYKINPKAEISKLTSNIKEIFQKNDILKSCFIKKSSNDETKIFRTVDYLCDLEINYITNKEEDNFVKEFDLSMAPLIRIGILENKYLLIDVHRIILDDTSLDILVRMFNTYGEDEEEILRNPSYEINDYLGDYHMKNEENMNKTSEQLFDNYTPLVLPTKNQNHSRIIDTNTDLMKQCVFYIKEKNYDNVNKFIELSKLNPAIFFMTIYNFVVFKYSGQENICSSFINNGCIRNDSNKNVIGNFSSIQPLLLNFDINDSLRIIYHKIEDNFDLNENGDYSLSRKFDSSNLSVVNNGFIFDTVKENKVNDDSLLISKLEFNEENLSVLFNKVHNIGITFTVREDCDQYIITINYNDNMYDEYFIENIGQSYMEVVQNTSNFDKKLNDIEYISEEEKNIILNKFNENVCDYDPNMLYHSEFSKRASVNPDLCAVIFENQSYTYGQIDKMSNSLAHYLRSVGIKNNVIVPIVCKRSYLLVVSALSILKAGGAFLFIDHNLPEERIRFIINEVKAKVVIRYLPDNEKVSNLNNICIYNLENHDFQVNTEGVSNINKKSDTCCVFFTSGTTGKPKGIALSHTNIINYTAYSTTFKGKYEIFVDKFNTCLSFTPVTYVIILSELFYPLMNKKTIILCNDSEFNNPKLLGDIIVKHSAEIIICPPTRIKYYIANENFRNALSVVRFFIFGGEGASLEFLENLIKYTNAYIYYGYGSTEVTATCVLNYVSREEIINKSQITMGKPGCNCFAYILDKNLKPVPVGCEGEIYASGKNICKGYLNQEALNKKTFIPCPFDNGLKGEESMMYKTGDLGKWTKDGKIIYIGRSDYQIKIRGQRVELSEIESTINEIKGIESSVVIDKLNKNNEKYLVGYYITRDENINSEYIQGCLRKTLPIHMVPNYFIKIKEIPITVHGKLNRKLLPEPDIDKILESSYIPPETTTEKKLCRIFSQVFSIDEKKIGKNSSLFDIGADSLNLLKTISRISKEFNVKLTIKDMFSHFSVVDLGSYIDSIPQNQNEKIPHQIEVIKRHNSREYPVTPQQLGVYIDSMKHPNNTTYNLPISFILKEGVDVDIIKRSLQAIFQKHEVLRSRFYQKSVDGQIGVYGCIGDKNELTFENYTFENVIHFVRPFDLSSGLLIRVGFIENKVLLLDMHHLISDGSSIVLIKNEINQFCISGGDGERSENHGNPSDLKIQFSDYAIDLDEKKRNGYFDHELEFYKKMFSDNGDDHNESLSLPKKEEQNFESDMSNKNETFQLGYCQQTIDGATSKLINEFIKNNRISKTAFFITIYGFILSKFSGQEVIHSSIMTANRNNVYIEDIIGMFVSTQPISLKYDDMTKSFLDLIKQNMNILYDIYNYQNFSLTELSSLLNITKINNSFIFQPKTELNSDEEKECYTMEIEYNSNSYEDKIIKNIITSYGEILKNINQLNNNLLSIDYMPAQENDKIIKQFNSDVYKYDIEKVFHEEFVKAAVRYPERTAIVYNEEKYSYKKVNQWSNSLAHYLRKQGIGRNDIVPIIYTRSPYFIIAIIGIAKAGGAFLPIDNKLPNDRIQFILEEVKPKIVLYFNNTDIVENLEHNNANNFYDLEKHDYDSNIDVISNINDPRDICYILYTSGTTGLPKGAMVSHYNIYNYIRSLPEEHLCIYNLFYKSNTIQNVLAVSNFSFDISHIEITISLIHGLTIVLSDDDTSNNLNSLSNYISKNNVELINTTPSRFKLFMGNELFKKVLSGVKAVILTGEQLPLDLCKEIQKYSKCKIYNGYGPTECSVDCSFTEIDVSNDKIITIGKPLCNCFIYILDKNLKPVPIGVEGEIYIGGYGVGKGYLNREELTNEKFIECPFTDTEDEFSRKMYRTGDLGKWNENGEIICLGRIDFQIKLRGQRIELGEIETTVNEVEGIKQSVVIDGRDPKTDDQYLICYYISESDDINMKKEIRNHLKQKLPTYMIPNYFKRIESIPITNNGKLNRKALPEPDMNDFIKEEYVEPKTDVEKLICKIYSNVFKFQDNEIGILDDFFELGGDSLNAIRVSSIIRARIEDKT